MVTCLWLWFYVMLCSVFVYFINFHNSEHFRLHVPCANLSVTEVVNGILKKQFKFLESCQPSLGGKKEGNSVNGVLVHSLSRV